MELPQKEPVWIDKPAALQQLAETLLRQSSISVDTESNSLFAYREQVCLIQFSTDETDYLVDPLSLKDLSPLGPVFANPEIEKIFHAAEYDVICLKRDFGFEFSHLFDTMLAARIMGRQALGLGALLEEEFGLEVDKRMQRANWSRRPLPASMAHYARMDTHYLAALRNILEPQLQACGRMGLAEEDFRRLTRVPAGSTNNNGGSHWRIAGAQDLTPRQAAVLMELHAYREEMAQAANQPPFRILSNQTLLELAQLMPRKRSDMNRVFGLSPKLLDRYGAGLLSAVERGIVGPPAYRPVTQRPSDAVLWRNDTLRNWRKLTAREMGVESDVVMPRDVLETIAEHPPHTIDDLGVLLSDFPWRLDHFGRQIMHLLAP